MRIQSDSKGTLEPSKNHLPLSEITGIRPVLFHVYHHLWMAGICSSPHPPPAIINNLSIAPHIESEIIQSAMQSLHSPARSIGFLFYRGWPCHCIGRGVLVLMVIGIEGTSEIDALSILFRGENDNLTDRCEDEKGLNE